MHLQVALDIATDPRTAATMMADPAFARARVTAAGGEVLNVDVTDGAAGPFSVTTRSSVPTDMIPSNLRPFIGSSLEVRLAEAWEQAGDDGHRRGTVSVEIPGAPVRLTGTVSLTSQDGGTQLVYDGELKASVPLFGAKLESAASRAVQRVLRVTEEVARAWVAEHDAQ